MIETKRETIEWHLCDKPLEYYKEDSNETNNEFWRKGDPYYDLPAEDGGYLVTYVSGDVGIEEYARWLCSARRNHRLGRTAERRQTRGVARCLNGKKSNGTDPESPQNPATTLSPSMTASANVLSPSANLSPNTAGPTIPPTPSRRGPPFPYLVS